MTKLIYAEKADTLDNEAANIIQKALAQVLLDKPFAALAVCGGRSVSGIFAKLRLKKIPWERVHFFLVDERLVPIDHQDSNFLLVKANIIDGLVSDGMLPEANMHPFVFDPEAKDKGIRAYEIELRKYSGRYDAMILSSGEDGHVGALYPQHSSIRSNAEYFITMDDSPKPPKDRMTSSRKLLLRGGTAVLVFLGHSKKEALQRFLDIRESFFTCPIKLVQDIRDSYVVTNIKV